MRTPAFTLLAAAALGVPQRIQAQPIPRDSTSRVCMDVSWLAPDAICSGRLGNSLGLGLMGASFGALLGGAGGFLVPTECIGRAERAAVLGAIGGAVAGTATGLLVPYTSRRRLAERDSLDRVRAASEPPAQPWSWADVKPLVVVAGVTAAGGGAIGAIERAVHPDRCRNGALGGAATGAAVYGGGFLASATVILLGVRFLF